MKRNIPIRILALVLCVFLVPVCLWADTVGKISGKITDQETGDPLPGANVIIQGTSMGAAADVEGDFFILNVEPGRYSIQASVIGYQSITVENVLVSQNHTTPLDIQLPSTVLEAEAITVTGQREVIRMDESSSLLTVESSEVFEVPMVSSLEDFLNQLEGVEDMVIRGGGLDQTELQVDGMMLVNNAQNRPMMGLINLSSVQELSIIKGGFSAEYGNVRSGVISVITKSGSQTAYHGSVDFRFAPAQMKHSGLPLWDLDNYYLRPYFDPDVAFVGTQEGWDDQPDMASQYGEWEGWNSWAERQPELEQTAQEAQDLFRWYHRADGADKLGHPHGVNKYGNVPDWMGDLSLSGPVPLVGKLLGGMTFFMSYKNEADAFALPMPREYVKNQNFHLKLSTSITSNLKLKIEMLQGQMETARGAGGAGGQAGGQQGLFMSSGNLALLQGKYNASSRTVFYDYAVMPIDISRGMLGVTVDHILSPKTYYSLKVANVQASFDATEDMITRRNFYDANNHEATKSNIITSFGGIAVDESPYGYSGQGYVYMGGDNQLRALGAGGRDWTTVNTIQVKFDFTSQVNKYNQLKAGFLYNTDELNTHFANQSEFDVTGNFDMKWHFSPYRFGGYVRNKIEFQGMIADIGLRLDVNEPNGEWFSVKEEDRYAKYYRTKYRAEFQDIMRSAGLMEPAKGQTKVSPRLGVSHPISDIAKLYFNYGHFYSMPSSDDMFTILSGDPGSGITNLGNPSIDIPRTIAYEMGYEREVGQMYLFRLVGYYKDVSNQTGEVQYVSYDNSVDYSTFANNFYADIRGLELRIDKRVGKWLSGWFNYDYRVETNGRFGRATFYEDARVQMLTGLMDPYQERPLARPLARANVRVTTPRNFGPAVGSMYPAGGVHVGILWRWKAGMYETWDPLSTYELFSNIQWKDVHNFDLRLEKRATLGKLNMRLFADLTNIFDLKNMSQIGFGAGNDYQYYMASLHLPMYDDPEYKAAGLPSDGYDGSEWNDRPGDAKSSDKPYIDMPNRDFLTYLNPRRFLLGVMIDF